MNMGYNEIPKEYDFDTEFTTYVIAYCIDSNTWFVTNQRFWYFQFDNEFETEEEGIKFFESNLPMISKQQEELCFWRDRSIYLENINKSYII